MMLEPATATRPLPGGVDDREPGLWADLAELLVTRIAAFEHDITTSPAHARGAGSMGGGRS